MKEKVIKVKTEKGNIKEKVIKIKTHKCKREKL
jgi:hypothetical protein